MDHIIALKSEQTARIVLRETALYVHIGAIFAYYAAEGQAGHNLDLLQLIRASSMILSAIMFSIYLSNDYYVGRIGKFISESGADQFGLWEAGHRSGWQYIMQKVLRISIVYALFGGWSLVQFVTLLGHSTMIGWCSAMVCGVIILSELFMFSAMTLERRA